MRRETAGSRRDVRPARPPDGAMLVTGAMRTWTLSFTYPGADVQVAGQRLQYVQGEHSGILLSD